MIKVGIIGSGFGLYGLLPAFNAIKECKVVSICGKKTNRLIDYCKSIGLKNIYTDWEDMLNEEKLDIIALAVPPQKQYEISKVAISKNINIFAEKPLAKSLSQAKELLHLATKKGVHHSVDFIFSEIDEWKKVKKIIRYGSLGKLKYLNVDWDFLSFDIKNQKSTWKTDVSQGGGALSFYFSHTLYYLEYFAGKILHFKSKLSYSKDSINGGEVGVDVLLKFKNGSEGYAHLRCNTPNLNKHRLEFIFEQGRVVLENKKNKIITFTIKVFTSDGKQQIIQPKKNNIDRSEDERVKIVKKLAARFINACIHNRKMIPSFKEGVRVQKLIEDIRNEQI